MTQDYWLPPRDYVGYGLEPPAVLWPDNKKVAVSFVLNYEEGAERTPWNGDDQSCNFLHELHYSRPATSGGKRDGLVEDMYGWKWTTWACARAFETSPTYAKLLAEEGHEIACHGNRWVMHGTNLPEAKAHIHKSFDRLQQATGLADVPTGWYAGGMPNHTKRARAEVHRERGVPLLYCSDTYSSDTPYWVQDPYAAVHGGPDEGMLMIPYSLVTNDHRFFVAQGSGVSKPDDWLDMLKAEFDQLCEEGAAGAPKMMCVSRPRPELSVF
ncbi:hypothetical protein LTR97_000688 [Elasticomyces elasticus]|uniref:NodB homology domain-containing protein n=1 Tax=Elasticomyces elasticus TaxID=574655 RepID=A0AAN7WHM5_9PEZI|nr:hypothetical protein LTR97_000688 [Elasticomyces elasticus]